MSNPEHSMAITGVPSDMIATGIFFAFTLLIFFLIIFIMAFCLRGGNEEAVSPVAPRPCSLNAVTVASLPSLTLRAADFEDGVECAVCLSELAEGEAVRKLPHCGHIFHVACIDMWFYSHCTCPLCRSAVTAEEPKVVNSSVIESADSSPITVNALDASASRGREEDEVVIIEIR